MGSLKLSNDASSTLAGSITSSDTLLSVTTGDGAKFPSLGSGDWHPLTVVNASGGYEIMKVTARTGDVLTVSRAQEGTAGTAFASGSRVDLRMTAAAFESLIPDGTAMLGGNNLSDVSNVVSARANLGLGSAATHNVEEFASADDGALAATAMQPFSGQSASAAKVASTGAYADLSGTPDLTVYTTKSNNLSDLPNKATARSNLGLATVASSGSYNDLSSKPSIPSAGVPLDSYGSVGQFVMGKCDTQVSYGGTIAGSSVHSSSADGSAVGSTLSGTWRCLGEAANGTGSGGLITLLQRIA